MTKKLLVFFPFLAWIGYSFIADNNRFSTWHNLSVEGVHSSEDPPPKRTGAPGEGNCTDCHLGALMSGDGVMDLAVGGGPGYTPGETYFLSMTTTGGPRNGFQLTILDSDNNAAGTFTAGANNNVISFDGRDYVRHSTSGGETVWNFEWKAPDAEMGELTAYYSMVKSDNNGNRFGDEMFVDQKSIPPFGTNLTENELDKAYHVFYNELNHELNLNYSLKKESKVVLNIQTLNGQLVDYFNMGYQPAGTYEETLPLTKVRANGVYLLSLFVNNQVFNRKVYLQGRY